MLGYVYNVFLDPRSDAVHFPIDIARFTQGAARAKLALGSLVAVAPGGKMEVILQKWVGSSFRSRTSEVGSASLGDEIPAGSLAMVPT